MTAKAGSNLISRIMVAMVIVVSGIILNSIILDIWRGEVIATWEKFLGTVVVGVIILTFGFVWYQRTRMRKTEKFRREKW